MEVFLVINGWEIEVVGDEPYDVFIRLATGKYDREELAAWIESRITPIKLD